MTTAHRPTYDPVRGRPNEQAPTRMFSSRSLPAHTVLKFRSMGQASTKEIEQRDLRTELLEAEAAYFAKKKDPYGVKKISENGEEREKAQQNEEQREREIAMGNPLLNLTSKDFSVKRRWDDDVIFKNQAKGISDLPKKEFVNDLLRTEFHRKFMKRYVK
ncbi:hypothetical protein PORY_000912 [Pneumocystis oryctolagi]|uniref:Uncharacterized protein n=1 Tax=Pneumocystis oryctolagi TaxID=42067 RepID=A0ACB7CE01_9ASCO|nr:hypothetical protein PORY_000912 [Pneumocystis oryctolagi]